MRLLQYDDAGRVSFTKDLPEAELPNYRYAILSHTWGPDEEEVTYDDVVKGTGTSKPGAGSEKIRFCIEQARRDGLGYFWVDTCCIDKRNLVELSRALISMFRWYSNAAECYAFLSDVAYLSPRLGEEQGSFCSSRWFTRGWTLQELLAPPSLHFFSSDGNKLGTKASLRQSVSEITGIPVEALDSQTLANFTTQDRLSWQANRHTKEEEDKVYSLLGIFDVSMPVLYGEGLAKAHARLSALLEQPEVQPKPSSNIPFRRDPHFIERPTLTEQIRARLALPAGRVALVGLGGVGKSKLAIEYARQLRNQLPETWVFWIHASSAARFEQSVRDVADQLRLHGRKDPKADHLQLLQNWLCDQSRGSWMIVLDNAHDAGFLVEPLETADKVQPWRRRIDYIPSCDHGSVLFTARSKSEALKLVYEAEIVDVLQMAGDEADALLEGKIGYSSPDNQRLVQALDCMPLAITQAAAYIRERGSRCSVQQYYGDIEQNRGSRISRLQQHIPLPDRDVEASNSVMRTWQISFEHIYQTQRSAADLLSFISFCDRLFMPESLIRMNDADADSAACLSTFEDDIATLRNFSFISETANMQGWEMHRLVQDATQVWLEDRRRLEDIRCDFVHRLYTIFPTGDFENWSQCHILYPHVINVMDQRPTEGNAQIEWASVMYNGAWYAREQGALESAFSLADLSKTVRLEQLGEDDEATCLSATIVALVLRDQGRWEEAEQLNMKVLETRRAKLGPDYPDTLIGIGNLASTYRQQGRYKEAEQLEVKVSEMMRAKLGPDHPGTLTSIDNLASTYRQQGRYKEAEQLEVKVLEMRRAKLGPDHPDTLISIDNLASTYWDQGRWAEAEDLQVKVLEMMRVKLGPDHPDTLISINNLASTYWSQGRWEEAEQLEIKVLETRRAKLGPDHPGTLTSMNNLASTYWSQGRYKEAEQLEIKVLETRRVKLGPDHPDTLMSIDNLASTYRDQNRWAEAEDLQTQAVGGYKKSYGLQHPETQTAMSNLAYIQRGLG